MRYRRYKEQIYFCKGTDLKSAPFTLFFIAAVFASLTVSVFIQIKPVFSLNLIGAYKHALKYDHGYKAAFYAKKASGIYGAEGLSLFLPQISASVGVSRYDFLSPPPLYFSFTSRTEGISLTQPIIDFKRYFEYAQYGAKQAMGSDEFSAARQDFITRVAEIYLDVLAAENYLKYLKVQKKAVHEQYKQAKELFKAGSGTKTDVYEALARYYSVESDIVEAKNSLKNASAKFKGVVGLSAKGIDAFKKGADFLIPVREKLGYWIGLAEKNNPDLKYYENNSIYRGEAVKKDWSMNLPTLAFTAGYSTTNTQEVVQTPALRYYTVGFQLSVPIFDGGYSVEKSIKSENISEETNQELERERGKIIRKLTASYLRLKGYTARINMLKLAVKSAGIVLKADRLGFASGTNTMSDVLSAMQKLYDMKTKLLKAQYEYLMVFLALKSGAGVLSASDLYRINKLLENKNKNYKFKLQAGNLNYDNYNYKKN